MNMGFVLTAMGGYGTYLGWKIRDNNAVADVLAPGPAWANCEYCSAHARIAYMYVDELMHTCM